MGEYVDRRRSAAASRPRSGHAADVQLREEYPALHDMMTTTELADGKPRATTTLLIFTEAGWWKCCVRDRDAGEVAFVADETYYGLLGRVEKGLEGNTLDWRPERQGGPQGRRKGS